MNGPPEPDRPANYTQQPFNAAQTTTRGVDYVTLAATVVLGVVASVALIAGYPEPALVAVGAVAGYITRLNVPKGA